MVMPAILHSDEAAERWTDTLATLAGLTVNITLNDDTEQDARIVNTGVGDDPDAFYGMWVQPVDDDGEDVGKRRFLRCDEFRSITVY